MNTAVGANMSVLSIGDLYFHPKPLGGSSDCSGVFICSVVALTVRSYTVWDLRTFNTGRQKKHTFKISLPPQVSLKTVTTVYQIDSLLQTWTYDNEVFGPSLCEID